MNKHDQIGKVSICAFTLVEVVIAMALMILALSAFIGAFVMAKKSALMAENRAKAVHDARSQMERLLACRYIDAPLSLGGHPTTDLAGVSYGVAIISNSLYTVKNITVTSKWVNAAGSITSVYVLTGSMSSELHQ
ncbi:MAG: type II secretion system protein [Verrucomicrobiota bacterium]